MQRKYTLFEASPIGKNLRELKKNIDQIKGKYPETPESKIFISAFDHFFTLIGDLELLINAGTPLSLASVAPLGKKVLTASKQFLREKGDKPFKIEDRPSYELIIALLHFIHNLQNEDDLVKPFFNPKLLEINLLSLFSLTHDSNVQKSDYFYKIAILQGVLGFAAKKSVKLFLNKIKIDLKKNLPNIDLQKMIKILPEWKVQIDIQESVKNIIIKEIDDAANEHSKLTAEQRIDAILKIINKFVPVEGTQKFITIAENGQLHMQLSPILENFSKLAPQNQINAILKIIKSFLPIPINIDFEKMITISNTNEVSFNQEAILNLAPDEKTKLELLKTINGLFGENMARLQGIMKIIPGNKIEFDWQKMLDILLGLKVFGNLTDIIKILSPTQMELNLEMFLKILSTQEIGFDLNNSPKGIVGLVLARSRANLINLINQYFHSLPQNDIHRQQEAQKTSLLIKFRDAEQKYHERILQSCENLLNKNYNIYPLEDRAKLILDDLTLIQGYLQNEFFSLKEKIESYKSKNMKALLEVYPELNASGMDEDFLASTLPNFVIDEAKLIEITQPLIRHYASFISEFKNTKMALTDKKQYLLVQVHEIEKAKPYPLKIRELDEAIQKLLPAEIFNIEIIDDAQLLLTDKIQFLETTIASAKSFVADLSQIKENLIANKNEHESHEAIQTMYHNLLTDCANLIETTIQKVNFLEQRKTDLEEKKRKNELAIAEQSGQLKHVAPVLTNIEHSLTVIASEIDKYQQFFQQIEPGVPELDDKNTALKAKVDECDIEIDNLTINNDALTKKINELKQKQSASEISGIPLENYLKSITTIINEEKRESFLFYDLDRSHNRGFKGILEILGVIDDPQWKNFIFNNDQVPKKNLKLTKNHKLALVKLIDDKLTNETLQIAGEAVLLDALNNLIIENNKKRKIITDTKIAHLNHMSQLNDKKIPFNECVIHHQELAIKQKLLSAQVDILTKENELQITHFSCEERTKELLPPNFKRELFDKLYQDTNGLIKSSEQLQKELAQLLINTPNSDHDIYLPGVAALKKRLEIQHQRIVALANEQKILPELFTLTAIINEILNETTNLKDISIHSIYQKLDQATGMKSNLHNEIIKIPNNQIYLDKLSEIDKNLLSTKTLLHKHEFTSLQRIKTDLVKLEEQTKCRHENLSKIFELADTSIIQNEYNIWLLQSEREYNDDSLIAIKKLQKELDSIRDNKIEENFLHILQETKQHCGKVFKNLQLVQIIINDEEKKNTYLENKIKERASLVKFFQAETKCYLDDRAKRFRIKDFFFSKDKQKRTEYVAKLNSALETYLETGDAVNINEQITKGKQEFAGKIFIPIVLTSLEESIRDLENRPLEDFSNENSNVLNSAERTRLTQILELQTKQLNVRNKNLWCKHRFFSYTQDTPTLYLGELKELLKTGDINAIDNKIDKGIEQFGGLVLVPLVLQPLKKAINETLASPATKAVMNNGIKA